MTTIYLEPNQVPAFLRGAYKGKQFSAQVCTEIEIDNHAGYWDGGSRTTFEVVRHDGKRLSLCDTSQHPLFKRPGETSYKMVPGFVIVEHSIFCGRDMGLRFHVHPDDVVKMLPNMTQEESLSRDAKIVLYATGAFKSSYGGISNYRYHEARRETGISLERWEAAKAGLIEAGYLNKAGAITTKGKNASQAIRSFPAE